MVTISRDDTRVYLAGRRGNRRARIEGRKQGDVTCLALCALPPIGVGEPKTPGSPSAEATAEMPALDAAEEALLRVIQEIQDVGESVEGCTAVVFLGGEMSFYEY